MHFPFEVSSAPPPGLAARRIVRTHTPTVAESQNALRLTSDSKRANISVLLGCQGQLKSAPVSAAEECTSWRWVDGRARTSQAVRRAPAASKFEPTGENGVDLSGSASGGCRSGGGA